MKTNIVKTGAFCLGGVIGAFGALVPHQAFASIGWDPSEVFSSSGMEGVDQINTDSFDQSTIYAWVQTITNWAFGIAVVLFVLKVVLTAIDRMVFDPDKGGGGGPGGGPGGGGGGGGRGGGRQAGGESLLAKIPFIGAYDASLSWKEIWKNFAKNVAIVAGAWVLVNIVATAVMFAFTTLTQPANN